YTSPALTQKVFANIRRVGKGFSGVKTPLFKGMLVIGEHVEEGIADEQVQDDVVIAATQEDLSKIESVKNWEAPKKPSQVRLFLGLAGYYRRFIENFSKIAKSLTILTSKNKTYN
nr:putative reverse transcriptase domain-containing protein [Tanacetum cinerariifolium]